MSRLLTMQTQSPEWLRSHHRHILLRLHIAGPALGHPSWGHYEVPAWLGGQAEREAGGGASACLCPRGKLESPPPRGWSRGRQGVAGWG